MVNVAPITCHIHREVVDARACPWIGESMEAVARVVDTVPGLQRVRAAVDGEPERPALDREVFPRPGRVR
jgi:hypothetical protein